MREEGKGKIGWCIPSRTLDGGRIHPVYGLDLVEYRRKLTQIW